MNRFAKLATAAVAAASMTMAAPARADNDAAKVIAGLLGVAILGAVISDLADNDRHVTVVTPPKNQPQPRPLPRHFLRYTLPKDCVQSLGHSNGNNALLAKGCLNRNFAFADKLPKSCEVRYWNQKRSNVRKGYTLTCLERHGYRVAQR